MKRRNHRLLRSRLDRVPRTFLALALVIMTRTALGEVIHVPQRHATIQAAVDAARDGDEILVGPGRWHAADGASVVVDLRGKSITLRAKEGPATTILDGQGRYRVLQALGGETEETVIEGFTITRGKSAVGAGAHVEYGRPTFRGCHFTRNVASQEGGGLYSWRGSPALESCVFTGNVSGCVGSCIYVDGGSAWLGNCDFVKNAVRGGGRTLDVDVALLSGGPIGDDRARCTSPDEQGTVVFGQDDGLILSDCRFTSNVMHGARAMRKTTLEVPDFVSPALCELPEGEDSPCGREGVKGNVPLITAGGCGAKPSGFRPSRGGCVPSGGCGPVRRSTGCPR